MIISFSSYIMMDFLKTILSILVGFFFFAIKLKQFTFYELKLCPVSTLCP